ncbi:MAG: hypothetical protein HW389_742 [Bacteroidetes bacterium]|nr:hypothetical protein [Bacteroidota bacterium]
MTTKRRTKVVVTGQVRATLTMQPGQSVKELATRLRQNRQFMSGFLAALEESGMVAHRQVGPARIYFNSADQNESSQKNGAV